LSGHPSRYSALPIADRLAILAVAVTQFLVGHGRVWTQPFDWDRSILWSYATIALLVFADLAVRRRLHLLGWFLHTLELSAVKFVLTAGFLVMYLITHPKIPDPGREPPQQPAVVSQPLAARRNLKPTVIAEGSRGEIHGRVIDRDGRGIQGALVFISDGLKDLVFAPPEEPVTLENNGKAFVPPIAAVQTGQPLSARSANHELHTLLLTKSDRSWGDECSAARLRAKPHHSIRRCERSGCRSLHGARKPRGRSAPGDLGSPILRIQRCGRAFRATAHPEWQLDDFRISSSSGRKLGSCSPGER